MRQVFVSLRLLVVVFVAAMLISACVSQRDTVSNRLEALKSQGGHNANLADCRERLDHINNADQYVTTGGERFTVAQLLTVGDLMPLTRQTFEVMDPEHELLVCAVVIPETPDNDELTALIALWQGQSAWL